MLLGLLTLAWIGSPPKPQIIGKKFPGVDLEPLIDVESPITNLDGRPTVIHFWGTWCPPCRQEFPEFAELHSQFSNDERVNFWAVSCSSGHESNIAKLKTDTLDFMQELGVSVPMYCDPAAFTRGKLILLMPNGSFGYPTTLVIDGQGVIVEALEGYRAGDMAKLADTIRKLTDSQSKSEQQSN